MSDFDWSDIPEDESAAETIRRYCRLSAVDLKILRDRYRELANQAKQEAEEKGSDGWPAFVPSLAASKCDRLAQYCDQLADWARYPWDWDYIISGADTATLRGHAKRVRAAAGHLPDAGITELFQRAAAYRGYDPEKHRKAVQKLKRDKMGNVSTARAAFETVNKAYDWGAEYRTVRRPYEKAAAQKGREWTREEIEELTEAILWATPDPDD